MKASEVILEYVCPLLGVIMGNIMFSAPFRDVRGALRNGKLGELNPTPWAFMLGNCAGWVTYGILIDNLFVFFGNAPALVLSSWLNMQAVKLQNTVHQSKSILQALEEQEKLSLSNGNEESGCKLDEEHPQGKKTDFAQLILNVAAQKEPAPVSHERLVVVMVLLWLAVISLVTLADVLSQNQRELIVGVIVNLNLVFFYGAPLSTIWKVLQTKSTDSIHRPTMWTNTLNGTFWCAYGTAVLDMFIIVPNGLGALLGAVQFVLTIVFPRSKNPEDSLSTSDDNR